MKTKTLQLIRSTNSEYRILRITNKLIKKFLLLNSSILLFYCSFFLLSFPAVAQAPESFKYQAALRDNTGDLIVNQMIAVRATIHNSSSAVYSETHTVNTNDYGLVFINVGEGSVESGVFSSINWGADDYFLQIEINNGSGYTDMGQTQLLSVPYSLYAKTAESISGGITETDPTWNGSANTTGNINRSGNIGIGTTNPTALLHTNGTGTGEGSVVFVGSFKSTNPGPPPVSGSGTRMMWYPDKAAFRTGNVSGTAWNQDSIGNYSVAMGNNSKAIGSSSYAFGSGATASETSSIAMGASSKALGRWAIALGNGTIASGEHSTAIGFYANASGIYSTAIGRNANATGNYAFAINLTSSAGPNVGANTFRISGATEIGGNVAWTNHSDKRLKKNIELLSLENNLSKIMQLNGVRYEWKEYNNNLNLGFIAQDVVDIVPEAVRYDEENDIYSMEYTAIIPILVEGMKEQQEEIEQLKALIEQQQVQISTLIELNAAHETSASK